MKNEIYLYNTLSKTREKFEPLNPGLVGIYVCGPTVYGDAHLGHARPAITYDLLVRLFSYLGYRVRYVRNITDVGHLENDSDFGEDKILKKARLEQLEPMEVVQRFTIKYHEAMRLLNTLPPSIEPRASGHIIEQIQLVERILEKGYAYVSNGSVYFDVEKYNDDYRYGILSGRALDDMMTNTRVLDGQADKKSSFDFALWKKAAPEHIMKWPSPWSEGFPGWHLECSAMSTKYLGERFDIHGGGMDLLFPHHECEIAQNTAVKGESGIRYWMHNNMITINGQKMGKSLGNFITLEELLNGTNPQLSQAYSPMTIKFFMLQAHYRSTLDFSNDALQSAERGLKRLMQAGEDVTRIPVTGAGVSEEIAGIERGVVDALCDDLNSPVAIAGLFDAVRIVNSVKDGHRKVSPEEKEVLVSLFSDITEDVLGLRDEKSLCGNETIMDGVMDILLEVRASAKSKKDFTLSDDIRDRLTALGVVIKDTKEGTEWSL